MRKLIANKKKRKMAMSWEKYQRGRKKGRKVESRDQCKERDTQGRRKREEERGKGGRGRKRKKGEEEGY